MRVFGFEVRRAGGQLQTAGTAFAVRSQAAARVESIMAAKPKRTADLGQRVIPGEPYSDYWLSLPNKLEPKLLEQILLTGLAGNLWQQTMVTQKMLDTWPAFRKASMELRNAVASVKYVVHPFAEPDQEPSQTALDKASLVRRNLEGLQPDRFSDEEGRYGMIYDLCDSVLNGLSCVELLWDKNARDSRGARENRIRASAWVHPKNLVVRSNGRIAISDSIPEADLSMQSWPKFDTVNDPEPSRYLVARFKSKSGSYLGAGLMRVLAWYWASVMYGREFALNFAQKYGSGFLDIAYQAGVDRQQVDEFERIARMAVNRGWVVHPNSGTITHTPAQSLGGDNAQIALMRLADEACNILLLGQTLTTSVGSTGGAYALGQVHNDVRLERIQSIATWIASILTEQFAETLLLENYGETSERPTIEPDFTRPLTPQEKGQLIQQVGNARMPLPVEPIYKMLDLKVPSPGDRVLMGGQIQVMEEALTQTEHQEKQFEQQLQQQAAANELAAEQGQVEATLAGMTDTEVAELEAQVVKAEAAPRLNGEWAQIAGKLKARRKIEL